MLKFIQKLFGGHSQIDNQPTKPKKPPVEFMGLTVGRAFSIDVLKMELLSKELLVPIREKDHIVHSASRVQMGDNTIYRFYASNDVWLQIVCHGSLETHDLSDVMDIKVLAYYKTDEVRSLDDILTTVAPNEYTIEGRTYKPVWTNADGKVALPVHLHEICYDETDEPSHTDIYMMLYERKIENEDESESLLVSGEVKEDDDTTDCYIVYSAGVTLTRSELNII